jgi:2-iminobutanoate/2-iminopropanoate deaminase
VRAGDWLICSGQTPIRDGKLIEGDIASQTTQCVANLGAVLAANGASIANVVKTTVFLMDMADFAEMNGAYAAMMGDHRPARSTIAVAGLPLGARVEIEAWAYLGA